MTIERNHQYSAYICGACIRQGYNDCINVSLCYLNTA